MERIGSAPYFCSILAFLLQTKMERIQRGTPVSFHFVSYTVCFSRVRSYVEAISALWTVST